MNKARSGKRIQKVILVDLGFPPLSVSPQRGEKRILLPLGEARGVCLLTRGCSIPFIFKNIFEILACLWVFDRETVFRETGKFTIGTVV